MTRTLAGGMAPLLLAGALVACGPSPQPIPPPGVVLQGLTTTDLGNGRVRLVGTAGSTSDATSLEIVHVGVGAFSVDEVTVGSDGSFVYEVDGATDDRFRLQATGPGGVSDPLTADGIAGGGAVAASPVIDCVTSPFDVVLPSLPAMQVMTAPLPLASECANVVGIDNIDLILGLPWTVTPDMPTIDLTTGMSTSFDISWDPDMAGTVTNVVVVMINESGVNEQRIVTLRGEAL